MSLSNGFTVRALPVAPTLGDPKDYTFNTKEALETAHAGLTLGQEVARIQDIGEQIKLERARRKAELAQLDHAELLRQAEAKQLPDRVDAGIATLKATVAEQQNRGTLATAQANAGIPTKQAVNEGQVLDVNAALGANALAGAKADANTGYAGMSTPEKTSVGTTAQAAGAVGIPYGANQAAALQDFSFAKNTDLQEVPRVDPVTGNTYNYRQRVSKLTGKVISEENIGLVKLGTDEKSVTQASKEATTLLQSKDMADQLLVSLDAYAKSGKAGLGQALATNAANSAPTGAISVIEKAIGASLQNPETVKIAGEVQSFKNTIGNSLFGSALSKEESSQLQGMLPTNEDLADPARAKEKLAGTIKFLNSKLKPYEDRGILTKLANQGKPAAPAATTSGGPEVGGIFTIMHNGQRIRARYVKNPTTGQMGYVPVQ